MIPELKVGEGAPLTSAAAAGRGPCGPEISKSKPSSSVSSIAIPAGLYPSSLTKSTSGSFIFG